MEQVRIFENSLKRMQDIKKLPTSDERESAFDKLYDDLPGWKGKLFDKYRDALRRGNQYMDFDDLPDDAELPALVYCLKECRVKHVTVSSRLSSSAARILTLQKRGCVLDGMVEINGKVKNPATGCYEKEPAFLLVIKSA